MWDLYDELLAEIPEHLMVDDYLPGVGWTYVRSGADMGMALTVKSPGRDRSYQGHIRGASLKAIAQLVKSWNFVEASIGTAAINTFYNTPEKVKALGGFLGHNLTDKTLDERKKKDAFIAFQDEVAGKNVTVVGHFPHIEKQLKPICNLSVLERNPNRDDYPDSACEYILAEQDYVFITGMAFINKTLPRLLQIIGDHAKVSIVGPSIPLSPILFSYGVDDLSGFCVQEQDILDEAIRRGGPYTIFEAGRMVSIGKS